MSPSSQTPIAQRSAAARRRAGRCASTVVLLLLVITGCLSGTVAPDQGPPSVDDRPLPSFEQLKRGDFEGILHGAGPLWSRDEYEGYLHALEGTPPLIVRHGVNLAPARGTFTERLQGVLDDLALYDAIPLLTIQFNRPSATRAPEGLDEEVARGDYDERIAILADAMAALETPAFLRIGAEVNGPWNGYSPEHYPAAYRRVVSIFRERDVERVIFVWNCKLQLQPEHPYGAFYPGDDVVDWWSIDLFGEDFQLPGLREEVNAFLADARKRGKPVMVPECAPSTMDPDERYTWIYWFARFFELLNNDPQLKAFCYSSRDFARKDVVLADWGNMRIDQAGVLDRYRKELSRAQYVHGPSPWTTAQVSLPPEAKAPRRAVDRDADKRTRVRSERAPKNERAPKSESAPESESVPESESAPENEGALENEGAPPRRQRQ